MNFFYPTPSTPVQVPKIADICFMFRMSPAYGETAATTLPNGHILVLFRHGTIDACMPDKHAGTYDLYVDGFPDTSECHLSEQDANAYIELLFDECKVVSPP